MPKATKHFRVLTAGCLLLGTLVYAPALAWARGKSADDYRRLLQKNPASAEYAVGLAQSLYRDGQQDQALLTLKDFLTANPDKNVARIEYGSLLATSRRFDEALEQYQLVLRTEPTNLRAQLGVAKVLSWQGQFNAALDDYDQILSTHPHYHDAMVGRAFNLLWMGRKEEAKAAFQDAANTNPRDKEVADQLRAMGIEPPPIPQPRRETKSSSRQVVLPKVHPKIQFPPVADSSAPDRDTQVQPADEIPLSPSKNIRMFLWSLAILLAGAAVITLWSIWKSSRSIPSEAPVEPSGANPRFTKVSTRPRGLSREPRERIPDLAKLQVEAKELTPSLLHQLQDSITAVIGYSQILDSKVEGEALEYVKKLYGQALRVQKLIEEMPKQGKNGSPASFQDTPKPAAAVSTAGPFKLRGRILLINESLATLSLQRSVLAGAGAEIVAITEVSAAVPLLGKEKFDALIVDADLSGATGWSDIHAWLSRNAPDLAGRMLLVCSAVVDPEAQERIRRSNIATIAKPLDVKQLLSVTHGLLTKELPA